MCANKKKCAYTRRVIAVLYTTSHCRRCRRRRRSSCGFIDFSTVRARYRVTALRICVCICVCLCTSVQASSTASTASRHRYTYTCVCVCVYRRYCGTSRKIYEIIDRAAAAATPVYVFSPESMLLQRTRATREEKARARAKGREITRVCICVCV